MNAARLLLSIGFALACAQASAHPPGPHGPGHHPPTMQVPQPVAPSALPYEAYRYGDEHPYAIDHERYGYDTRGPCIAQNASHDRSRVLSGPTESSGNAAPNTIDWCALAPYRSRYAPQIPASWCTPRRYGRTR